MKVLFVDDDQSILSGLRRMLYRSAPDWDLSFALGGEAALDLVRGEPFDVVVTDMRMPNVDGAAVLDAVRNEYPGTVRIVLSGHNELATALRTVPLAHQCLTKPCDPDDLRAAVGRASLLQESLGRSELLPMIGGVDTLPSPPSVIIELNELLSAPEADIDRIVAVVSSDPAISAKLLQMVNSAFFGVAKRVGDVGTAVRYLGIVTVRNLAVAVHAFRSIDTGRQQRSLVKQVQQHSTAVAELAQLLVRDKRASHEAYVAALLHDIGSLVLATRATDNYQRAVDEAGATGRPLYEVELEVFGANHADIGAYFLSVWGLPFPIIEVVVAHHRFRELVEPFSSSDATYLADLLVGEAPDVHAGGPAPEPELPADVLSWDIVREALESWGGAPKVTT
jgi:putative nucleotidyltransferase with HDIG domain